MDKRLNFFEKGQHAMKPLFAIGAYLNKSSIDASLRELVFMRISQINGCAYCIDMHYKDARADGETEQRLYGLSSWRETPYYSEVERAALAYAEAVTKCKVTDSVYNEAAAHFSEEQLIDLTMAIVNINTWNRINLSFPNVPGSYQVGMFG